MKFKTLLFTLMFAVSMWAQTAAPSPADKSTDTKATASCCKDGSCCRKGADCCKGKMAKADCCKEGASCCKDGAACCGKDKTAKADCCKEGAACCKNGADCCKHEVASASAKNCCGGKMCQRHKA
jgi:hypothetical protein